MAIKRIDAPLESTWKRETTFPSWDAWDQQFAEAKAALPEAKAWSGKLRLLVDSCSRMCEN